MNRKQLIEELGELSYFLYRKFVVEGRKNHSKEIREAIEKTKRIQEELFEIELSGVVV